MPEIGRVLSQRGIRRRSGVGAVVISKDSVNQEVKEDRCLRYERIAERGVFETETRREIFEAVRDAPGGTQTEYGDAVGVDRTTARYHLRILEHFGYIQSERDVHLEYFDATYPD